MNKTLATLDLIESHVNRVAKTSGKPYSATIVHYTVNGERKEKMVMDKKMRDHITQNFHSGDTVIMTWEENKAGYQDLVGMTHDDGSVQNTSEPTATKAATTRQVGNNDREVGMQVGNALTNATNLMANNHPSVLGMDLYTAAMMVVSVGERMKKDMVGG